MNKIIRIIIGLLLLCACQQMPKLTITSSQEVRVSAEACSTSITFKTNQDWSASCPESWVQLFPESGTGSNNPDLITVFCELNRTWEDRVATVVIRSGEATQTVIIRQTGDLGIEFDEKSSTWIDAEGGLLEFDVLASDSFEVKPEADWIHYVQTKGPARRTVVLSIDINEGASRGGKVRIDQMSGKTIMVGISQGSSISNISGVSGIDAGGGQLEFIIRSNAEFEVKPEVDWIHHTLTKAWDNRTVTLTIDPSDGVEDRSGLVNFVYKNGDMETKIRIEQVARLTDSEVVDMGLSVKWRNRNLNAASPLDFGDYYAWGETKPKEEYSWETHKWCEGSAKSLTKYNTDEKYGKVDGKIVLDPEDDAARVTLGGKWRMPTQEEIEELANKDYCTSTFVSYSGVMGYRVKSLKTGNSIFIPSVGSREGAGYYSGIWSASLYAGDHSLPPYLAVGYPGVATRCNGRAVRPVTE